MDDDYVQLKWNTHHAAFLENLSDLRDKQVFTDVTLSCGSHFYPAHRLVLTLCSSFLGRALEVVSNPSPVLLLYGITQETLEHLLMFMYDGQVTVSRNELPQLLKAANWLGVKGLDTAFDSFNASTSKSSNEAITSDHTRSASQLTNVWKALLSQEGSSSNESSNQESAASSLQDEGGKGGKSTADGGRNGLDNEAPKCENLQDSDQGRRSVSDKEGLHRTRCMEQDNSASDVSFEGWDLNEDSPSVQKLKGFGGEAGSKKRSLRCKHCKRSFTIRSELAKHIRMYHDSMKNYCFHCSETYFNDKDFRDHMKQHSIDNWHSCEYCDFVAPTKKQLTKHLEESHEDDLNSSQPKEKVRVLSESELKNNPMPEAVVKLEAIPIVKCNTCFQAFRGKKSLLKHQEQSCYKITKSFKGFHCPLCNYISKYKQCVQDHLCRHTGKLPFQCSYCSFQCKRKYILRNHIIQRHPNKS